MSPPPEGRVNGRTTWPSESSRSKSRTSSRCTWRWAGRGSESSSAVILCAQIFSSLATVGSPCPDHASNLRRRSVGNAGSSAPAVQRRCSPFGYSSRTLVATGRPAAVNPNVARCPPSSSRSSRFARGAKAPWRAMTTVIATVTPPASSAPARSSGSSQMTRPWTRPPARSHAPRHRHRHPAGEQRACPLERVVPDDEAVEQDAGEEEQVDDGEEHPVAKDAVDGGGNVLALAAAGAEEEHREDPSEQRDDDGADEVDQPGEGPGVCQHHPLGRQEGDEHRGHRDHKPAGPAKNDLPRPRPAGRPPVLLPGDGRLGGLGLGAAPPDLLREAPSPAFGRPCRVAGVASRIRLGR